MARTSKKAVGKWTDQLDEAEVREALEDACVDAKDEYEQHSGLLTMIQKKEIANRIATRSQ